MICQRLKARAGFSMLEIVITVALVAAVGTMALHLFPKALTFIQRSKVRQAARQDSRIALDTIQQHLRNAKAKSVIISNTGAGASLVPHSRIEFDYHVKPPSGASRCVIYLSNGQILIKEGTKDAVPIASNVSGLTFTGDSKDPGLISLSLRIDVPIDPAHPERVATVLFPNQLVRMVETP